MASIPKVPSSGLLGDLKTYVRDPLNYLEAANKEHGDIFRFRVANRKLIFINHPDDIAQVLQGNHKNYRKNLAYRKLRLLLGDGLFTSEGSYWLKQRRLVAPAFHKDRIRHYAQTMYSLTTAHLESWKDHKEVNLSHELTALTLQIVSTTLLGEDAQKQIEVVSENLPFPLQHMLKMITSPTTPPAWFPTPANMRFKKDVKKLDEVIYKLIDRKSGSQPTHDLLSALMQVEDEETGEKMSRRQLRDEVITFYLAGHETSAIAAQWTLWLLGQNPEWVSRIRSEIGKGSMDEIMASAALDKVIKESMRLKTPIWILGREALGPDELSGYKIEQGDSIIFSPYMVHRHPEFWNDPEVFNPDRFDNAENEIHRFAYFPFGGGPRLCVGHHFAMVELKVIIGLMLQKFEINLQPQDPGYEYSITLRPAQSLCAAVKVIS